MHTSVAQILADKVLQVETFKRRHRSCQYGGLLSLRHKNLWFLTTWEISNEDDFSLVVQRSLNLLELGPPGREVDQQRHQPGVWLKR